MYERVQQCRCKVIMIITGGPLVCDADKETAQGTKNMPKGRRKSDGRIELSNE